MPARPPPDSRTPARWRTRTRRRPQLRGRRLARTCVANGQPSAMNAPASRRLVVRSVAEGSKPPSVRPGIRLSARRGVRATNRGRLAPARFRRSTVPHPSTFGGLASFPRGSGRTRPGSPGRAARRLCHLTRLITRSGTCRCCSSASGLPLRTCVRSPARTVGGLSSPPGSYPRQGGGRAPSAERNLHAQ